ncbi:MAG TPA: hypothetical protein DCL35_01900 [Candidatus Omnitrophica bacterium]|nr:hypothetical protein [Candidatus Omnitrophota bacterium]
MRVIFITREGRRLAGARVRCYNFAAQLRRYGVDAQVLSFADSLGAMDGESERRMGFFSKLRYNHLAFSRLAGEEGSIFYIQRFNYHAFAPLLAGALRGNKIVLDLDDWEMREDPRYCLGFYPFSKAHFFTRLAARRSVACIAASRFLEDFMRPFNANVYYIPTCVDTVSFEPSARVRGDKGIIFSWIGTFNRKEYVDNIRLALGSFVALHKKYPNIYFDILGDGVYRQALKEVVAGFNDSHIQMKGWLSPEDVPAYLGSVDIGLLPVVGETKFNLSKSPTKLFEYMACGKPVVASAVGEAKEIIRDGDNGFLARTQADFTEKLEALIADEKLGHDMGARARCDAQDKYSLDVCGRRLFEALKTLEN